MAFPEGYKKARMVGDVADLNTAAKDTLVNAVNELKTRDDGQDTRLIILEDKSNLPHYDSARGEYVNLDQYWNSLRTGGIYTVEFNKFSVSPSSLGTKKDDNEGLVMEVSTNTVKGRDDYSKIGLFKSIVVNAYVDSNDDYHVTAIRGDGKFKNDGTNGDVYVMAMPGYFKWITTDATWGISYSDVLQPGYEILDEAVKPDGTIRPYLLHAKYVAGRNPLDNKLASISGVYPEYANMSHDNQITLFKTKGTQYSGKTSHDDFYVQLMLWLKYATMNSDDIMKGCQSYYLQYVNLIAEAGVNHVTITNAQAGALLVGSCVSIGDYGAGSINTDRQIAQNYNIANRVIITNIVDLGNGNSTVEVSGNVFDTTLTTTITTYPWYAGGCDNVLGTDGSPYSASSGKEPCIINNIEIMVGGYEVLQNLQIYNNNTDPLNYKIQLYACYDCTKYKAGGHDANYDLVGYELAQTQQAWKYISEISVDQDHPSIMVPVAVEASSATGFGDALYTNNATPGYREWLSLGRLNNGADAGLRILYADFGLSSSYWIILGRLSATGRSRRRAGVN